MANRPDNRPVSLGVLRGLVSGGLALLVLLATGHAALARDGALRIATWNIANLHHAEGESVPGRDVRRSKEDYTWLRHYAYDLNADVVALQEINSRAAAHRLFSRGGWTVIISGRKARDLDSYDLTGEWPDASIYTGFAVRKKIDIVRVEDITALEIDHVDPRSGIARPTRRAIELEIEYQGRRLILLGVHLKSGCTGGALRDDELDYAQFVNEDDADCTTAARQVGPLRDWIERRAAGDILFVILGDFNRAFDAAGADDDLWQGMSAGLPDGQELVRLPQPGRRATCWSDAPPAPYYRNPIDHLVFDPRAARQVRPRSFGWLTYDPTLAVRYDRISDHCPAYVDLDWPALAASVQTVAVEADPLAPAWRVDVKGLFDRGLAPVGLTPRSPD